jgi:polysaccharide pyruvyl transferase WcaK-like protein
MNLVVPFGFYGYGNTGDEGALAGFGMLLSQSGLLPVRVFVASRNFAQTARAQPSFNYFRPVGIDPRRWVAKLMGSAHAMVGGTPIQDTLGEWPLSEVVPLVRSADRWNVPFSFIGVGVQGLRSEESRSAVTDQVVPRVRHWSVRSEKDRERLIEWGASADTITVAADLAWLIESVDDVFAASRLAHWGLDSCRSLIGVNLVNENSVFDQHPQMAAALATALDSIISETNAKVLFLSQECRSGPTFDSAAAARVVSQMNSADNVFVAPNEYFSPSELMAIISRCCFTITMRYHFCVFSALQGVPFVAIERTDKLRDLCWDLDWTARVTPPFFEAAEIVGHARRLRQNASPVQDELTARVRQMRQRALRNRVAVEALIRS